jgi:hypothetical protein
LAKGAGSEAAALMLLLSCSAAAPAWADGNDLSVYGGYTVSSSFQTESGATDPSIESSAAYAASLGIGIDAARQVQLFYSQQSTKLGTGTSLPTSVPLTVRYLHVGGTYFVDGTIGSGAYVAGGIGATQLSPNFAGLQSEVHPSFSLGLGYQLPLGSAVALRLEARGYLTGFNGSGYLFCKGGCVVKIKSDLWTQGEVMLGLTARF